MITGTFEDTRFRSESKNPSIKSVDILGLGSGPELEKKLKYTEEVCTGVIFGKELVNAPANVLTPGQYFLVFPPHFHFFSSSHPYSWSVICCFSWLMFNVN